MAASCIYCGARADADEHWLPRALGTFGELQVLHNAICNPCNLLLGRDVDEAFLRTGPEANFRAGLGIEGRRGLGGNPFMFKAATEQPVRAMNVGDDSDDDADLFWELVPGDDGNPQGQLIQQIVVHDKSGARHVVPFNPAWTARRAPPRDSASPHSRRDF